MRKRIVINLDTPEGSAARSARTRSRRWPRLLKIVAGLVLLVVVVVAILGFLAWRSYSSTPTYSLALMLDAAQRGDTAEFQKRIDDEEIAKNMTATVSQKAAGRYGLSLNTSVQQRVDAAMPALLPRVKQAINEEVFSAMKQFAAAPEQQSFLMLIAAVQKLMTVTTEGNTAKATGSMAGHNLALTMRRDGNGWKVIDVKDDIIVQRVVDAVVKELPPVEKVEPDSQLLKKLSRGNRAPRRRR